MQHSILGHIETFESLQTAFPGPVPLSVSFDFGGHSQHAIFGCMIHGNETGSLPAANELILLLSQKKFIFKGKVTFFIGNKEAALKNMRALEADLNRVFTPTGPDNKERRRALELMPLLKSADIFVDFHQTVQPAKQPFYIFGFQKQSYLWARAIGGASVLVTRSPRAKFEQGSLCCDEFTRQNNGASVTLELGEKGINPAAHTLTLQTMMRTLQTLDALNDAKSGKLERLAHRRKDFLFYKIVQKIPFGNSKSQLEPGFLNFSEVKQGQILGTGPDGRIMRAIDDGISLFPKYPERNAFGQAIDPVPVDIIQVAQRIKGHPLQKWR